MLHGMMIGRASREEEVRQLTQERDRARNRLLTNPAIIETQTQATQMQVLRDQHTAALTELRALKERITTLTTEAQSAQTKISASRARVEIVQTQCGAAEAETVKLRERITELEGRVLLLGAQPNGIEVLAWEAKIATFDASNKALTRQLAVSETQNSGLDTSVATLSTEKQALQVQLNALTEASRLKLARDARDTAQDISLFNQLEHKCITFLSHVLVELEKEPQFALLDVNADNGVIGRQYNQVLQLYQILQNPEKNKHDNIRAFAMAFDNRQVREILGQNTSGVAYQLLTALAVLLTGIIPGIVYLCYQSAHSPGNSVCFWRPVAENVRQEIIAGLGGCSLVAVNP